MSVGDLPMAVEELLRDHIDSFEQLDLLLLFADTAEKPRTVAACARGLRLPQEMTSEALEALTAKGLLAKAEVAGVTMYRYKPASATLANAVSALVIAGRKQRVDVLDAMSRHAFQRARKSADLFARRRDSHKKGNRDD